MGDPIMSGGDGSTIRSRSTIHRLIELLVVLQVRGGPTTRSELRGVITDYRDLTQEAYYKLLADDLADLRAAGLRIHEFGDDGTTGEAAKGKRTYLAARGDLTMPTLTITPNELLALHLAMRTWGTLSASKPMVRSTEVLARAGTSAAEPFAGMPHAVEVRVDLDAAALTVIATAVEARRPVTFTYRGTLAAAEERRWIDPWGVVIEWGRQYVVGFDRIRSAARVFRASRIADSPQLAADGTPDDSPFTPIPTGVAPSSFVGEYVPVRTAHVSVQDHESALFALELGSDATTPPDDPSAASGWTRYSVRFHDAAWIAGIFRQYGDALTVEEPDDVRELVALGLAAVADQVAALLAEEV